MEPEKADNSRPLPKITDSNNNCKRCDSVTPCTEIFSKYIWLLLLYTWPSREAFGEEFLGYLKMRLDSIEKSLRQCDSKKRWFLRMDGSIKLTHSNCTKKLHQISAKR